MKISRKNLKRLIAENLKDQKQIFNEANLRKYQNILGKAKQAKAKEGSPEYEAVVRASQELSAMKHGDPFPGESKPAKKGPFKKKNSPRYERADALLSALIDFYEAGGSSVTPTKDLTGAARDRFDQRHAGQDKKDSSQIQPDVPGTGGRYTKTDNFPIQKGHSDKSKGHIAAVQRKIGVKPDGYFGPNTEKALKDFTRSISIGPSIIITKSNYELITNSDQQQRKQ